MADQNSIELLAFTFASRTFAYRSLEQRLSSSLSTFSSFIREYPDPVIKADQCVQNVEDTGTAAKTPQQLIKKLRAVFQCLREASLKFSMAKCYVGVQEADFLGRTITTKGVAPQKQKINKFCPKGQIAKIQKSISTLSWFFEPLSKLHTWIGRTTHSVFSITQSNGCQSRNSNHADIMKEFRQINEALGRC